MELPLCKTCESTLQLLGVLGVDNMCPGCQLILFSELSQQPQKDRENFFLLPFISVKADHRH